MVQTRSQISKAPTTTTHPPSSAALSPPKPICPPRRRTNPKPPSPTRIRPLTPTTYGLIQERLAPNAYHLTIQAILWNQTRGLAALPVLTSLLHTYPTPSSLASASLPSLTALLRPIGLHNVRAKRLIALGRAWVARPPCREMRYRKLHYPVKGCGGDVGRDEVLDEEDARLGWEVAHLPGVGAYALDSFRIFARDEMRGGVEVGEEEWRRVRPLDRELRGYLRWRWAREGVVWDG